MANTGSIVVDGSGCGATPPPTQTSLCSKGKHLSSLQFTYNAKPCSASHNTQASGKWSCSGTTSNPIAGGTVRLVIMDTAVNSNGTISSKAKKYFDGSVVSGQTITAPASAGGKTTFTTQTYWAIYSNGTLVQSGTLHTSCSQPVIAGDEFGALVIAGGTVV